MAFGLTRDLVRVYCDESSQDQRFMLISGLWVPAQAQLELDRRLDDYRARTGMIRHMKWKKVSGPKFEEYKDWVDLFFGFNGRIWLNALALDQHRYPLGPDGDEDLSFYKLYYQLLLHRLDPEKRYEIVLAQRPTRKADILTVLYRCLNAGMRKMHHLPQDTEVVRDLRSVPEESLDELQLVDVLMGAFGWAFNSRGDRGNARQAKVDLAAHIAHRLNRNDLVFQNGPSSRPVSVWVFRGATATAVPRK